MSSKYTFLPWSRYGVANSITAGDNDASIKLRASIPIDLTLATNAIGGGLQNQTIHNTVQLYGPGDIVGIDQKAILRIEPRNWITNFESNLLAYVEFVDADFPWRYTPAATTATRTRPWLTVVALTADEFTDVTTPGRPLPSIQLATGKTAAALFPNPAELWAWAHVHYSGSLSGTNYANALAADSDLITSRLLCPRHLAGNTTYYAFLIPTFESGRLAGLGQTIDPSTVATASAWANNQAEFPYYYRWQFRTGTGDFEYLVSLLKPQPADDRVGVRPIDVLHPGANLPGITNANLAGVLQLGGALRVPLATLPAPEQAVIQAYDTWDQPYPSPFEQAIAAEINLADDYQAAPPQTANSDKNPDPVVTLPLYGRWHALTPRLLVQRDKTTPLPNPQPADWVHNLNLDPRWRVAAGIGTSVVQANQEAYADAAWQQVGDVLAANALLSRMQLSRAASAALYKKHLVGLDSSRQMMITAPASSRVVVGGTTVRQAVTTSNVPIASISSQFRAMVRTRGRLAARVNLVQPGQTAAIVQQLQSGSLVSVRPWNPPNAITMLGASNAAQTASPPSGQTVTTTQRAQLVAALQPVNQTPTAVTKLPAISQLTLGATAASAAALKPPAAPPPAAAVDSESAVAFKSALAGVYALTSSVVKPTAPQPMNMSTLSAGMISALDPHVTIPKRYAGNVSLPSRIVSVQKEPFVPVMAYPQFDLPMYQPLVALSTELFLPNMNLIPQNSLTLLENNQRFIEAYMVGLNHEMARELLWREYPTDQRGSYFRQFWDPSACYPGNPPPADILERYRDIPPLTSWSWSSQLGDHDQRASNGDQAQIVLVIRGELLKRYPNTVLFAMQAVWAKDAHGNLDPTQDRQLIDLAAAEQANPPTSKVKTPLFEARISPDLTFVGFDLTAIEARGALPGETPTATNAGWFFVLQERPGEPRFGIEIPVQPGEQPRPLLNWNNLDWGEVGTAEGANISLAQTMGLKQPDPNPVNNYGYTKNSEDDAATWGPNTTAAQLAYILYRELVVVAVHAHRMLPS
jgi:hypothetical protein